MRLFNLITFLLSLLIFAVFVFLAIDTVRAQPIGEWDPFSIHLNGDNDSSISANILFPQGITIPDLTSGTQQIVLGDGSSGSGLTGNGFIYLEDDGFSSRTLNLLGGNSSLNSGVGFILQGGSSTAALASGGGFFLYGGSAGAGGQGGDIQIRGGSGSAGGIGGIVMLRGGTASAGTYGYIRTAQSGTPGHFTLSNATTRDSLYVVGHLEVDGTTWLDGNALVGGTLNVTGASTLGTLTGILKATSGLVAVASGSDLASAISVTSPITNSGSIGFDFSTNNTWTGTNLFENDVTIQDSPSGTGPYLNIGDNSQGAGWVSIQNDPNNTGNLLLEPQSGFSGEMYLSGGMGMTVEGNTTVATSATNYLKVGINLSSPQATLSGDTHGIFVTKQESSTTGAIAGVFEAEFAGASASASAVQALNAFSHNTPGAANLTATAQGGGLRNRYLTRQRATGGTVAQMSSISTALVQDASTATVTFGTPINVEAPTIGAAATMTEFRGINFETAAVSGTVTTSKFLHIPALTFGSSAYEVWMDGDAGTFYRESSQQIYSSASKTLDLDTSDTTNFRIGTAIEASIQANRMVFNAGASDPYLDWTTSGQLDFGVGAASEMRLTADTLTFEAGASDVSIGWASSGVMAITATSLTNSGTLTSSGNITISKATPLFQFTDSGGDDYSIDVGAAAASRFRIRNSTDSTTAFDVDGTNRIAMSTNYSPQAAYKVYVQDRQTAASPAAAYAALSSAMEYLPSATTTTMNQNLHGYQGGITAFATNGSISGSGVFLGLRGDAGVQLGNALTNSQSATGLFGSMTTTQASGTGGINTTGNAVSTFISAGANTTITTAAHFRVGNSSASGTITNLYGFYADAFSVGTNRFEGFMGTDAGWFFREAGNQINSSAAATLDIDATTTTNFRIGTAIEGSISANRMTFNAGASDPYLDWSTSGELVVGGGLFRTTANMVVQATSFTPYASGYELSVQSAGTAAYIEILANTGAGLGSFFGTEVFSAGSNVHFALYNWEGQALGSGNFPITFYAGYGSIELAKFDRTGGVVFNDTGEDVDFRVESDTDANNIFSDASANFVGIGTASPGVKLDVAGAIRATTDITSTDTGDLGWAVVDGTDNTACTSQCTNAAVFGLDLAAGASAPVMVGPSSAAADLCLCAGAS